MDPDKIIQLLKERRNNVQDYEVSDYQELQFKAMKKLDLVVRRIDILEKGRNEQSLFIRKLEKKIMKVHNRLNNLKNTRIDKLTQEEFEEMLTESDEGDSDDTDMIDHNYSDEDTE